MNLKPALITLSITCLLLASAVGPAYCERSAVLTVCQELVNQARAYESRAQAHASLAKAYMVHIENLAKLPKNTSTAQAMDSYFAQYDQNRTLERKFTELYRQATEEAKQCMKNAD